MKKLEILTGADNPVLRKVSEPVKRFDAGFKKLVKQMKKIMIASKGLGLAAPQIGRNLRVFLVILNYDIQDEMILAMVNPKIVSHGADTEMAEEGCLSLPGVFGKVERFCEITVEFFDLNGTKQVLTLSGLDAREVQHENDHINGVLFIDRMKEAEEKKSLIF